MRDVSTPTEGQPSLEDQEIRWRTTAEGATIVELPSQVRKGVAEKLGSILAFLVGARPTRLLLDFSKVERIESAGIAAVLFAHRTAANADAQLGIIGISPSVKRLFTIARIDSFFEFFDSEEAALA